MADKLLAIEGVSLNFGGLAVVADLDIVVGKGEIVSVIGPNGAGKTTLFNLITGIYRPDAGDILLEGTSLVGLQPHQISQRGVSRTVMFRKSRNVWNVRAIPRPVILCGSRPRMLSPANTMSPPVGS